MDISALFEYLVIILGVLVLLLVRFFIGREFLAAAEAKGYTSEKYLWWIMFTGIPGMLLVIALPDRGTGVADEPDAGSAPAVQKATPPVSVAHTNKPAAKQAAVSARSRYPRSHLEAEDVDSLPRL